MSRACAGFERLMRLEASGNLTARQFARLDRHREACAACSARLAEQDPLDLFHRLVEAAPAAEWRAGMWEGIRAGIQEEGRLELGESFRLLRPAYQVGLAAVLALAVGLVALWAPPVVRSPGPTREVSGRMQRTGLPGDSAEVPLPTVESISSPGARIYEMKVFGEGDRVSELVLIFDESIDL